MAPSRTESLTPGQLTALYAALTLIMLAPVLTVRVPCLGDTLNHLARIHILTTIGQAPWLQRLYEPGWKLVPYLGMDVPVAALARFMPIYDAGRVFTAVCVIVPAISAAVLQWAVSRRIGVSLCPDTGNDRTNGHYFVLLEKDLFQDAFGSGRHFAVHLVGGDL